MTLRPGLTTGLLLSRMKRLQAISKQLLSSAAERELDANPTQDAAPKDLELGPQPSS